MEISIELENVSLQGLLSIPKNATGIVVFAHGSGSGRFSPRNQFVAEQLTKQSIATLLLDLLTPEEEIIDEMTRELRFDIALLGKRVISISRWLEKQKNTKALKLGYFGSSTGAAAALIAAAEVENVLAVVSRGGRPDLAAPVLSKVRAATLLIVGGFDYEVIKLNQQAFDLLTGIKKMEIVPQASHLFEETGKLEEAAKLATSWFKQFLG